MGNHAKFEYILIPDVEEGPNILTAVHRWKAEGGVNLFLSPFSYLILKRENYFSDIVLETKVFIPKHNFVRIQ